MKKPTLHIMIDLETVGTFANAPILSIGAIALTQSNIMPSSEFYCNVDTTDAIEHGAKPCQKSLEWWEKQSQHAIEVLNSNKITTKDALIKFNKYISSFNEDVCVWGNGANFDIKILETLYQSFNLEIPWKYWNTRCFRTVKNIYPYLTFKFKGIQHYALDDAKHQAEYLLALCSAHELEL